LIFIIISIYSKNKMKILIVYGGVNKGLKKEIIE